MPKLTVAVTTYNRANLLGKTIQSILNQTFQDFIILILDNASQDHTEMVVKNFQSDKIKYVKNPTNIGWLNNTNQAFDLCQTDYLIIFHDDDLMQPAFLEREVQILNKYPDVAIVASNTELMDDNEIFISKKALKIKKDLIFSQYEYFKSFYQDGLFLPCPTVMFRMEFFRKNQLRFEDTAGPCADAYFWNKINTFDQKIYLISDPLIRYRTHIIKDFQKVASIGKNYQFQFLLHKQSFLLADKLSLKDIKPFIFSRNREYMNLLFQDYIFSKINKAELLSEIQKNALFQIDKSLFYQAKVKLFIPLKYLFLVYYSIKKLSIFCVKKILSILKKFNDFFHTQKA